MAKKMGRPKVEEGRKKLTRLSAVENKFLKLFDMFESENDKRLVMNALNELKAQ